jgi:hypothetical protein
MEIYRKELQTACLILDKKGIKYEIKNMFGGVCFMVDDKMCFGFNKDESRGGIHMLARVGKEYYAKALQDPHCTEVKMGNRLMGGYVFVDKEGANMEMEEWIDHCLRFNPLAKSSKKKRKK